MKNQLFLKDAGTMLVRILFAVVAAFPIVFMLVSSLKPDQQIFGDMSSLAAFLPVGNISFVNSLCAFALSRMQVRGKKIVFTAILATLIVPFQTLALPLVWWVNQLPYFELNGFSLEFSKGWLDTYQVQIIPFIANAFSIYLFHQYFESIPKELDEAARIDGAGWFKIYRQVVMPLSGPATATVAILTFLPAWNSYLWPLMVVQSEELRPVMIGIQYFFQLNVSWGEVMAYASLITVPVVVLFIAFQRSFVNSIASSGVKG